MTWSAQRLKTLRKAYDYTQAEFASHLGVSTGTIKYWETGGPIPPMACKFLDRIEKESHDQQGQTSKAAMQPA
jgi:DNA-binding transcriptional regulator YiaG